MRLRIEPTKHGPPPSRASQASSAPAGFGHRGPAHRNYLPSLRKRCKLVPGSAKLAELLVKVIVQTFLGSQRLLSQVDAKSFQILLQASRLETNMGGPDLVFKHL